MSGHLSAVAGKYFVGLRGACVVACAVMTFGCSGDDTTAGPGPDGGDASETSFESGFMDTTPVDTGFDAGKDMNVVDSSGDSGAPAASFPTTPIDLGAGNCGGVAVTQTLAIQNSGSGTLNVGATVTGTVFAVSPATLNITGGNSGTLTITATVPQGSTAGTALSSSLTVTTNDTSHASTAINLTVTPTGATLAWASGSPTSAAFGVQPINQAASPIALTLANTGNASASVALGATGNSQFTISPNTGTIAKAGTLGITANFTPNTTTASTGASSITVTGPVCGTSVSTLGLSGQGGTGVVTGWPSATLDFGLNQCGGAAPSAQTFTLANAGAVAAHITGATITGSGGAQYSTTANGATIPATGNYTVNIAALAVPFPSTVPNTFPATITFTTDVAGDTPHAVKLTEEASGAILAWDTSATPGFGNFGIVPDGTSAIQNFSVRNNGNASSNVTLSTATPFSTGVPIFSVAASTSQADSATFAPTVAGPYSSPLSMVGSSLCQPVPTPLTLGGTGQAGGVSISTQSVAFAVNCGTASPSAKTFTITNVGTSVFTWTASLGLGASSPYTISPTSATLNNNGDQSTVTITPNAIPQFPSSTNPSAFADAITVITTIAGDTPHTVALSLTPLGDILVFNPASLNFGPLPINQISTQQTFVIQNGANPGSATASVSLTSTPAGQGTFPLSASTATAGPGSSSTPIGVTFNSGATPGAASANIQMTTGDVLCAPLPANLTASGTATEAGPSVDTTFLEFNNVNCGSVAAPQQVHVTNTGNQDFTITNLALSNTTYYSVNMVPANGVVQANNGNIVTLTVTPNAIPGTVPRVPDKPTYSGTLNITTNANVPNPNFTVTMDMGAQGMIITNALSSTNWAFGTINYGSTGHFNVGIINAGNIGGTAVLTNITQDVFGLNGPSSGTTSNPAPIQASGVSTVPGTFTPSAPSGSWSDAATLVVTSNTVLCQPLPASWNMPTITLSGSSSSNAPVSESPGSINFGTTDCGQTAPGGQSITLTNNSNQAYSYTSGFQTGAFYTITSGGSGTVPANGTATITVTPTTVTPGPGVQAGPGPYADALLISVNTAPVTNFNVSISWTLNGAVLFLDEGGGPCGGGSFYPADSFSGWFLPMDNSGTASASVNFGFSTPGVATLSPAPPIVVTPGIRAIPILQSTSTDPVCDTTASTGATFVYSGPVCQPFSLPFVFIEGCQGSFGACF
jgi:hypothetical protein